MRLIKTVLMLFGWIWLFAICPPLGIAMLIYFIWKAVND